MRARQEMECDEKQADEAQGPLGDEAADKSTESEQKEGRAEVAPLPRYAAEEEEAFDFGDGGLVADEEAAIAMGLNEDEDEQGTF